MQIIIQPTLETLYQLAKGKYRITTRYLSLGHNNHVNNIEAIDQLALDLGAIDSQLIVFPPNTGYLIAERFDAINVQFNSQISRLEKLYHCYGDECITYNALVVYIKSPLFWAGESIYLLDNYAPNIGTANLCAMNNVMVEFII